MIDREVVITHLDDLRLFADVTVHPVVSPDNWDVYSSLCDYIDQIKTEVEILLKAQEPVSPGWVQGKAFCGSCGRELPKRRICKADYCPGCGREVKWNARQGECNKWVGVGTK